MRGIYTHLKMESEIRQDNVRGYTLEVELARMFLDTRLSDQSKHTPIRSAIEDLRRLVEALIIGNLFVLNALVLLIYTAVRAWPVRSF